MEAYGSYETMEDSKGCLWRVVCYIAIDLHPVKSITGRRGMAYTATAVLTLAIWLFMVVAESCPSLHAWMHGGAIPDNDDCAVVAIAHGKVETTLCTAPAVVPVTWIEVTPRFESPIFRPSASFLPDGRGPPVSSCQS